MALVYIGDESYKSIDRPRRFSHQRKMKKIKESARGGVRTHDGRVACWPALKGRRTECFGETDCIYKHEALTTELHEHFRNTLDYVSVYIPHVREPFLT